MDTATGSQIPDDDICISHSVNTLGNGKNVTILSPCMDK